MTLCRENRCAETRKTLWWIFVIPKSAQQPRSCASLLRLHFYLHLDNVVDLVLGGLLGLLDQDVVALGNTPSVRLAHAGTHWSSTGWSQSLPVILPRPGSHPWLGVHDEAASPHVVLPSLLILCILHLLLLPNLHLTLPTLLLPSCLESPNIKI